MPPRTKSCFTIHTAYTGSFTVLLFQPVSYSRTTEATVNLPMSGISMQPDLVGGLTLSGQIRNIRNTTIESTRAIAAFYNNKGKVTGCEVAFANTGNSNNTLFPNQTGTFAIEASISPASVANYILQSDYE